MSNAACRSRGTLSNLRCQQTSFRARPRSPGRRDQDDSVGTARDAGRTPGRGAGGLRCTSPCWGRRGAHHEGCAEPGTRHACPPDGAQTRPATADWGSSRRGGRPFVRWRPRRGAGGGCTGFAFGGSRGRSCAAPPGPAPAGSRCRAGRDRGRWRSCAWQLRS
ncbi:translation initiation factor IF-2 [Babesia caballi]|uniref:Translation initiation factor IF-2 n=1 Tax=Babesia caballi TaxID=5871 RepID=A0AAV4LX46_BABCB|nr:translation initiation factor IF-2 [Babesia caballi]